MQVQAEIQHLRALNQSFAPERGTEHWLTGYSDASFKLEPPDAGGGWGCWVRDSQTRILRAGPCPKWVSDSQESELCGVFAAIHTAVTRLESHLANIMVVKLDNQSVAQWFGWRGSTRTPRRPERLDLVCRALQAANDKQIKLVVTWVKGHRGDQDISAYLNSRVDEMARTARCSQQNVLVTTPVWQTAWPERLCTQNVCHPRI